MGQLRLLSLISLPLILALGGTSVNALPGQKTEAVAAWIAANPTLRPALGDGLIVKKSDTAAKRFEFQATVVPPGRLAMPANSNIIRSETFSFFDMIDGVTQKRLEDSLRILYGVDIDQDYQRSQLIYSYPTTESAELARRRNLPLLAAQKGELRLGERFGYWLEITKTDTGQAYNGKMTIFLKEDLDKLETELRNR